MIGTKYGNVVQGLPYTRHAKLQFIVSPSLIFICIVEDGMKCFGYVHSAEAPEGSLPKVHRNESASSATQCLPIGIPIIG